MSHTHHQPLLIQFNVRISRTDARRLEKLCEVIPHLSKGAIAREAMRIGMLALERDRLLPFKDSK